MRIAGALGAIYYKDTAAIHPGRLVRGLARVVERRGATIYEQTDVTGYTTGACPALHTARGHVRAKTIVLCGEAYLTRLSRLRRQLIPVYSLITLTEPLSPADWAEIGWREREMHRFLPLHCRLHLEDGGRPHPVRRARRALPSSAPRSRTNTTATSRPYGCCRTTCAPGSRG